jgi:hypothetical protein
VIIVGYWEKQDKFIASREKYNYRVLF